MEFSIIKVLLRMMAVIPRRQFLLISRHSLQVSKHFVHGVKGGSVFSSGARGCALCSTSGKTGTSTEGGDGSGVDTKVEALGNGVSASSVCSAMLVG